MFQGQPGGFDTCTDDQLPCFEMRVHDILATMEEGAEQQADEVGASRWTQPPPVLTQSSQLATGGATTGGGATSAGGGASPAGRGATPAGGGATPTGRSTPDAPGLSQAATPSPDQLGPRVVRAPDPWTYDRDQTWAGARALRGKRGLRIEM
jgi:hypothetical protein